MDFLTETNENTTQVHSDLQTMIIYSYYSPNIDPFTNQISMGRDLDYLVTQSPLLFDGRWIVRSLRQEMISYQAQDKDEAFWIDLDNKIYMETSRIYDNGFVVIYLNP